MATTSREETRDALVALLQGALVGAGLPVKTVSGAKVTSLQGITPLITVLSAGTERVSLNFQGTRVKSFSYKVQVWVLQSGTDWTTAQAGDALDDIEARVAAVYEDNKNTVNWELLKAGPTRVWEVADDGIPYYVEDIPTTAELATN